MKKISALLAVLMTTAFLFVGGGCDEVKNAITDETANKWYQTTTDTSSSVLTSSSTVSNANTYLYYNSDTNVLTLAVVAGEYCAKKEISFGDNRWNAAALYALNQGKIKSVSSDPTKGKKDATDFSIQELGADFIVSTLLGYSSN